MTTNPFTYLDEVLLVNEVTIRKFINIILKIKII